MSEMIDIKAAADLLGIEIHTMYRLARKPGFPIKRNGRKIEINKEELMVWVNSKENERQKVTDKYHSNDKKINMVDIGHLAWIPKIMLEKLDQKLKDDDESQVKGKHKYRGGRPQVVRTKWIQDCVKKDYGFELNTKEDKARLDQLVRSAGYISISDWLRAKIREVINNPNK